MSLAPDRFFIFLWFVFFWERGCYEHSFLADVGFVSAHVSSQRALDTVCLSQASGQGGLDTVCQLFPRVFLCLFGFGGAMNTIFFADSGFVLAHGSGQGALCGLCLFGNGGAMSTVFWLM